MSLSIQPVTLQNWRALARLKVREDQADFVASNTFSIAEAQFGQDERDGSHWDMHPFGIYDDDIPVGFLMYAFNYAFPEFQAFIFRLMVDENHQGRGYGKFAMEKMLEIIRQDPEVRTVGISYEPQNEAARKLYASFGFVETGEIFEGEVVAVCKFR